MRCLSDRYRAAEVVVTPYAFPAIQSVSEHTVRSLARPCQCPARACMLGNMRFRLKGQGDMQCMSPSLTGKILHPPGPQSLAFHLQDEQGIAGLDGRLIASGRLVIRPVRDINRARAGRHCLQTASSHCTLHRCPACPSCDGEQSNRVAGSGCAVARRRCCHEFLLHAGPSCVFLWRRTVEKLSCWLAGVVGRHAENEMRRGTGRPDGPDEAGGTGTYTMRLSETKTMGVRT